MLKNEFTKTSVGTLTLGEKLKKFRSERRVSLNEISRYTKIPIKYLEYLEEGIYDKLPVDVYVKGFLRNYADYLGIDDKLLIRHYEKERGIQNNLDKKKSKKKEEARKTINVSYFVLTPKLVIMSLITLLIGGGFFYLYREISYISDAPKLIILHPENNSSVPGNLIYIEGISDQDAKIFINDQPILTNDDGRFKEGVTLQSGTNIITVKSLNRFDKETVQVLNIQSEYLVEENQEEADNFAENKLPPKKLEMELRIDPGPIWVSVESDDNLVFSGTLTTGETKQFTADAIIKISSSRDSATYIKLNGQDIGTLGDKDESVKDRVFTPDTKY